MKTAKYFTAAWCGPCKAFKPVMNEVVSEGYSVQFIDIDQNQTLIVRQLDPTPHGLPLEIYCFTTSSDWVTYESIQKKKR